MLKVLYDDHIFKLQRFGGISRYFTELLSGLGNDPELDVNPKKFHSDNKHLQSGGLVHGDTLLDKFEFRGKARINNFVKRKRQESFLKLIKSGDFDIYHPTYYDTTFADLLPPGKPFVITVYDMIHEHYYNDRIEEISFESLSKRQLLPRADHIVAISQGTKNDILHFFPEIDPAKISVVYLDSSLPEVDDHPASPLSEPYILFVGNRGFYKNFLWFSEAISTYLKSAPVRLLCAGGGKFSEYEKTHLEKLGIADRVLYTDFKSDAELRAIYKNAVCFVFPSLLEGFGIPILEAFSCNCPVLLPQASCFPEIAGDAALYFEQGSMESVTEQVRRLVEDKSLAKMLTDRGRTRKEFFSWKKTVAQHKEIYKSVLQQSKS